MKRSLAVDWRPVTSITPYARNSRTHSDEQVAQIAASIKEFGWTNPILLDETGGIIAGHGRLLAAQRMGQTTVPTITLDGLTDAQRRAYVIADNKLALNSGWDVDALKVELQDIDGEGFDLTLTGFGVGELASMFDEPDFAPGSEDDQGRLDQLAPKMVNCPHCGQDFDLREHGQG